MEKQTVFIKRYPSKGELPEYGQRVVGLVLEQGDLGLSKFLWNVSYNDDTKIFKMDGGFSVNIEYWLEEIELPNDNEVVERLMHPTYISENVSKKSIEIYKFSVRRGAEYVLNKLKGEAK